MFYQIFAIEKRSLTSPALFHLALLSPPQNIYSENMKPERNSEARTPFGTKSENSIFRKKNLLSL